MNSDSDTRNIHQVKDTFRLRERKKLQQYFIVPGKEIGKVNETKGEVFRRLFEYFFHSKILKFVCQNICMMEFWIAQEAEK